ncbi:MalY/PatB family protein [Streptomyces sioyaensis]|uniref:MalY/PatB family protein n=1 Tax=Streptomyces sioyaensis TaxID=67364 RepID=UPI003795752A
MDLPVAEPVLRAIQSHLESGGDLGYAFSYTVDAPVHKAFAAWAAEEFDWKVRSEQVLLFPDVMRVIETAVEQFTAPGDAVVVDIPAYPPFLEAVPAAGRTLVRNPMVLRGGLWEIDFDGLERQFRAGAAAYILCNPHNPTGRVMTADELRRLLRLADAYRVAILSDEVHAPLVYAGHRHLPVAALPEAERVPLITATSASKGWNTAGLKCAFAVPGSDADAERLVSMRPRERDGVGILGVSASIAAFTSGKKWLQKAVSYLDGNRRYLLTKLPELLGGDIVCAVPEGTYLAWIDCRRLADRIGTADMAGFFLERGGVAVSDGEEYGLPGFMRLNFATSRHLLETIVTNLALAVHSAYDR